MNEATSQSSSADRLGWDNLTWQDIQAIGEILAEQHPEENYLTLPAERLVDLVSALPGFDGSQGHPEEFVISALFGAWIAAVHGDDDSSPYEFMA